MQVTCQCGVPLQKLDDDLRAMGYTTGHSPQSKPLAQMGGLVATRSIGQFSTLYGGIEDMLVGCEVVFPGAKYAVSKMFREDPLVLTSDISFLETKVLSASSLR